MAKVVDGEDIPVAASALTAAAELGMSEEGTRILWSLSDSNLSVQLAAIEAAGALGCDKLHPNAEPGGAGQTARAHRGTLGPQSNLDQAVMRCSLVMT